MNISIYQISIFELKNLALAYISGSQCNGNDSIGCLEIILSLSLYIFFALCCNYNSWSLNMLKAHVIKIVSQIYANAILSFLGTIV